MENDLLKFAYDRLSDFEKSGYTSDEITLIVSLMFSIVKTVNGLNGKHIYI